MVAPDDLVKRALALPEQARAELALRLLETLAEPTDIDDAAWVADVEGRADRFLSGESRGVAAADVFREAEARLRKR
jgi:hypothetical protein